MFLCADKHSQRCPNGHRYPGSDVYASGPVARRCMARRLSDRRRGVCGLITLFVPRRTDYLGIEVSFGEILELEERGSMGPEALLDILFAREPKERELFLGFLNE